MKREAGGASPHEAATGERKIVTVLFADIVNSTSIITSRDPEDANTELLGALHAACDCIRRYRGTVSQIMGDGVLAVFGAPVAQEDHALRAGLAAQEIHRAAGTTNRRLPMRIGLSSGEVVAYGSAGGVYAFMRVIGEPVHLAARMQERARPGGTIMSAATRTFMGARATTKHVGRYRLSGGTTSDIYELKDVHATTSAAFERNMPATRRFTTLVGRDAELKHLGVSLTTAMTTTGESLLITGEAGIGKSRLVREFIAHTVNKNTPIFWCDFQPAEIAPSASPLRRLVRRLLRSEQGTSFLRTDPLEAAALATFLEEEIDEPLHEWLNLAPAQKLDVSVRATTDAMIRTSNNRSFVLICEDFQYADTITARIIGRLTKYIHEGRIFLVCTARTTEQLEPIPFTGSILLKPLRADTAAQLVDESLGKDPSLEELKETLVREAQGNPLHLEECIASLVDSDTLVENDDGGYQLKRPFTDIIVPSSLRGALAARIDQLDPTDRNVLLHAAAIGRTFDMSLLATVTASSTNVVTAHLNRLQEQGVIRQSRLLPSVEYSFTHNLIQEVAYDTLLRRHRKQLHIAILAALAKRSRTRLPSKIELMANHAYRAEAWAIAYLYSKRAASRALAVSRNVEAKGYLFRALHAAETLGSTPRNLRRLIATDLKLVPSLFALGQHDEARDHLDECLAAAQQIGDRHLEAKVASNQALLHWITGNYPQAVRADRHALVLATRIQNRDQQVASTIRIGMLFCEAGSYTASARMLNVGLELIPRERTDQKFGLLGVAAVGARAYLARTHAELGDFRSAARFGDLSLQIAEECADPFSRAFARISIGIVLIRQGEYRRALPLLRDGTALCARAKLRLLLPLAQACQGYVAWQLNEDRAQARKLLESAVESAAKQKLAARSSLILSWLAEVEAGAGELADALSHAETALRLSRENKERGHEAWALWTLAEVTARHPSTSHDDIIAYYARAKRIAERRRMDPLLAHCELGMSQRLQQQGRTAQAISRAAQASAIYDRVGLQDRAKLVTNRLTELSKRSHASTGISKSYSAATS